LGLRAYFDRYVPMAVDQRAGYILESPTWRANPDWAARLGYDRERLAVIDRVANAVMREIRTAYETKRTPIVISGCIGPRGDGYDPGALMRACGAEAYHAWAVFGVLCDAGAHLVSAFTMTNINEALGASCTMPVAALAPQETGASRRSFSPMGSRLVMTSSTMPNSRASSAVMK
jgi:homocysteine S-methyltransferase